MTPSRPYLIRAIHEWILDNDMTPYVLVDVNEPGVQVPMEYAEDGKIILNLSPVSVDGLVMNNDRVAFNARFGGKAMSVEFPIAAAMAIYARENGRGMAFSEEDTDPPDGPADGPSGNGPPQTGGRPSLKIVK